MKTPMRNQHFHPAALRFARLLALALLPAATAVGHAADGTVARLVQMNGNVLVGRESSLASATEGMRLSLGARVLTTTRSDVVVEYDNGCRIKVEQSQRFQVAGTNPCATLGATPQSFAGVHPELRS